MAAVRGAAPGGVSRQELRAICRVAALLSRVVLGAAGTDMVRTTLGSGPAPPRAPPSASGSPGLHRAHAVHSAWVVGAHAALLQVTAVVCLQRGWRLSPARALGSAVPFPSRASDPQPHLPGLRLPALCCLEQRGPCWWGQPALACPSPTPGPCLGWGAHVEAAGVSPGLGQGAGAVGQLLQEFGQLVLQLLPGQALVSGPGHRVHPEVITQVPGQRVLVAPERLHIPVGDARTLGATLPALGPGPGPAPLPPP